MCGQLTGSGYLSAFSHFIHTFNSKNFATARIGGDAQGPLLNQVQAEDAQVRKSAYICYWPIALFLLWDLGQLFATRAPEQCFCRRISIVQRLTQPSVDGMFLLTPELLRLLIGRMNAWTFRQDFMQNFPFLLGTVGTIWIFYQIY